MADAVGKADPLASQFTQQPVKVTVSRTAGTANYTFSCGKDKTIEAKIYSGGKDPRAEVRLFDMSDKSGPTESRFFILKQKTVMQGVRFSTDQDTIVFTVNNNRATLEEYGQSVFRNCDLVASDAQ